MKQKEMIITKELEELIKATAIRRYPNNSINYYWIQVFIKEMKENGFRDVWIGHGKGYNGYYVNVYDQYLIHEGKLYSRRISSLNRYHLCHNIKRSQVKWCEIKFKG